MSVNGAVSAGETKGLKGKLHVVPVIDVTLTKRNQCAEAKATGEALEARVKKVDIVDNLKSNASDRPLSAKQGAELKRMIDELAGRL